MRAALLAGLLMASPAIAQPAPMWGRFDNCVFTAFFEQKGIKPANLAAELAFQACATEEQAIRATLAFVELPDALALAAIAKHKTALKQQLIKKLR